jgi:hypothetical protein
MGQNTINDIEKYRLPCYNSINEYMSLVGKTITYLPIENERNHKMIVFFGRIIQNFKVLEIKPKYKPNPIGRCDWKIQNVKTGWKLDLVVYYGD